MITPRQRELLVFIYDSEIACHSPNYAEIMDYMALKSKCGVNHLVKSLSKRGMITYTKGSARSIFITQKGYKALGHNVVFVVGKKDKLLARLIDANCNTVYPDLNMNGLINLMAQELRELGYMKATAAIENVREGK